MLDLWEYIYEREAVRHRRVDLGEDPPWTDDPTMRTNHLVNVFKEDDRRSGIVGEIMASGLPDGARLWNLLLMRRLCQTTDSWRECVGRACGVGELDGVEDALRARDGRHWSAGRQVYPMSDHGLPGEDVVARTVEQLFRDWDAADGMAADLREDDTLHGAYDLLWKLDGVGEFLAWQVALDARCGPDPLVGEWAGDWAPVTDTVRLAATLHEHWPWVKEGCDAKRLSKKEVRNTMRWMVDEQDVEFDRRGLDFAEVSDDRRLTVPDAEHVLCIVQRYWRVATGTVSCRRFVSFE